jgi:nucleoside-diphosphate kinase
MSEKEVLTFIAEHYDPNPQVLIKFLLKYYPESHEVEMKEIITGRKFLSLTKVADCNRHDFVLGGAVVILSRDLKLIDYGDKKTRLALSPGSEIAAVFLPPSALEMAHEVIGNIEQSGLTLLNLKAFHVPEREIENVAKLLQVAPAILSGNSNYCIYMEFRGLNAIAASAAAIGCCDILVAASSSDQVEAFRNQFLFTVHMPIARYKSVPESSCCVIKPHIIKSRLVGNVLRGIKQEGVEITAMQIFHMDRIQAAEFYDVYSGMKDFHSKFLTRVSFMIALSNILQN